MSRIIHSTSFVVNEDIEQEWIDFMQSEYLSYLKDNKVCDDILFTKVAVEREDGITYSLQLIFNDSHRKSDFLAKHVVNLKRKLIKKYSGKYISFSTTLTEL